MQPTKNPASSIALRVAAAMHHQGIESLPRNYELVYEAYSGSNPQLSRDFMALGQHKTQDGLDRLGRKYLPHHHDQGLLDRQNTKVRAEMSNFIGLLNEEKSSLTHYSQLIGTASNAMAADGDVDSEALRNAILLLKAATEQQAKRNSTLVRTVVNQTVVLADLHREFEEEDAARFIDTLTGLGNRRALNKALERIYTNRKMPGLCGLAVGEIDDFSRISEQLGVPMADRFLKHAAKTISAAIGEQDIVCRFDGGRFGLLFDTADEAEILRIVELVRSRMRGSDMTDAVTPRVLGQVPMSFGICMSAQAPNAFDLMTFGEKALATARTSGAPAVTIYAANDQAHVSKDWLIYKT